MKVKTFESKLYSKNPIQLKCYLTSLKISKSSIVDSLRDAECFKEEDESLTLLQLCHKYAEEIKDIIFEMFIYNN